MVIPFGCVATDIITGDAVVLREGKVWESVRASLSLPMIFRPYKKDSRFFVDGGLVNPVPASIISSLGADIVVSVNLTSKASERKVSLRRLGMFPSKSPGFFDIFFKMIYTMQYQIASSRTDISQISLRPDTRNFSWVDFHRPNRSSRSAKRWRKRQLQNHGAAPVFCRLLQSAIPAQTAVTHP